MADSRPIGPKILENLRYDPTVKSGLVWATSRKGARSGDVAGHLNPFLIIVMLSILSAVVIAVS